MYSIKLHSEVTLTLAYNQLRRPLWCDNWTIPSCHLPSSTRSAGRHQTVIMLVTDKGLPLDDSIACQY
jgi:hypothetical protein